MSWFNFEYCSTASLWSSTYGYSLSTSVCDAIKHFDAAISQLVLIESDLQHYQNGVFQAVDRCLQADSSFIMAKILKMLLLAEDKSNGSLVQSLIQQLELSTKENTQFPCENMHFEAARHMWHGDSTKSIELWDTILTKCPTDTLALHFTFFTRLNTADWLGMKNILTEVVNHYSSESRFYGSVLGKMCFALEECGNYKEAEHVGKEALRHTQHHVWSIHSLAHVYQETGRNMKAIQFLESTQNAWENNVALSHHLWWHKGISLFNLGQFEKARLLYSDVLEPLSCKVATYFALSDASSLLLRLSLWSTPESGGRWNESQRWDTLLECYSKYLREMVSSGPSSTLLTVQLFYVAHMMWVYFMKQNEDIRIIRKTFTEKVDPSIFSPLSDNFEFKLNKKHAVSIFDALEGCFQKTKEKLNSEVTDKLLGVRDTWFRVLGASRLQRDILDLILLKCVAKSENWDLLKKLIGEREQSALRRRAHIDVTLDEMNVYDDVVTKSVIRDELPKIQASCDLIV